MRRRRRGKGKRRKQVISIVILVIMVVGFTLAGVIMRGGSTQQTQQTNQQSQQTITYNGYEFTRRNNVYVSNVAGRQREFYFPPTRTIGIKAERGWKKLLQDGFTVTFNPNRSDIRYAGLARYAFTKHLQNVRSGVTRESSEYDLPVVTCDDASPQRPVVYLKQSNTTRISVRDSCVIIKGSGRETVRAVENVIYKQFGVIA